MRALPRLTIAAALAVAVTLTSTVSATAAVSPWTGPDAISTAGQNASDPQIATDGTTITAIWTREDGSNARVQASSSTNGGTTWSTPVTLSAAGQPAYKPQLVTDGTTITAIWYRADGSNTRVQTSSSTNGGTTWSTPVTLSAAGGDAYESQLVTDGTTITAIWDRYDGSNYRVQASSSTNGGATWSTPADVSAAGQIGVVPQLVTNGTTITAVWRGFDGSFFRVRSSSSTNGGTTWSTPVDLSAAGQSAEDPQLVTDGTTITATWKRYDGSKSRIQTSSSTDGGDTWITPVDLSAAGQNAGNAQVVTDGTTITATWYRGDGAAHFRIQTSFSTDGGSTWSTPIYISESGQDASEPQLATDGTIVTATWYGPDGSNQRINVSSSTDGGATWSTPVYLSAAGSDSFKPQLVTDGTTITTVWFGYDGSEDRIQVSSRTATTRLSGADRYATSAAISAAQFSPGVPVAYIANGLNFPDALSGAPVAGKDDAPVLLVSATAIPAVIQTELTRLTPGNIVVLGGTGVVSDTVMTALQAYTAGTVTRLSGENRYATSAAISAASFSAGVSVAYIAAGQSFPDALSGAPVAGMNDSPVLLVAADSIPDVIQTELTRLAPSNIVVLGGTGVVSNTVKTALAAYTSGTVTRLSGANRYATSAAISAANFSPGVSIVYIAAGASFPDALSGAPVAGISGSPVLLVSATSIPAEIQTELTRLQPAKIVILGGTGVVSTSVAQQLASYVVF